MKLIISEKPSTAQTIAHVVGAREKVYGEGKEFCYMCNDYYVVNARGHLYGLGLPQDYGYSKTYKLEELPIFPDFDLFPASDNTESLRRLISQLINLDEVDEIINACDAGREGELIFRHIYNANRCTKPVKRLWTNSMTDEAIRECMKNLPPDSDFDGEYYAALAREKSDWLIGMNLSRLYGVKDDYPHRIGRVKTPVLAVVVDRDNEIADFNKTVSYRLVMDNGAISAEAWNTREEAEHKRVTASGKIASVLSAATEEKKTNRPLLYSLTALQQEANRAYGLTAKQTLEVAQSLYEKKLITYPRTDCNYVSEDIREKIIRAIDVIGGNADYSERVTRLKADGLNLDSRVINSKAMDGHDHHAILPEAITAGSNSLSDNERKIYGLVINRLLCAVDKEYRYIESNYEIRCEDVIYTLKCVKPVEMGWKTFEIGAEEKGNNFSYYEYGSGTSFTPHNISVKECITKPKKHFTDDTLLSVMNNIDNRIEDKELKAAVSGKGIGTEATRAEVIEQLIAAEYLMRDGKNIISTDFGRAFIASIPNNVKSLERTAEWEQIFTKIKADNSAAEPFIKEIKEYICRVIDFENAPTRERKPVRHDGPSAFKRNPVGICPRCGKNVFEGKQNYYCESGKDECGFTIWKEPKYFNDKITPEKAAKLIKGEAVSLKATDKEGTEYTADYIIEDTGEYVNLKRIKSEKNSLGKCPRCGKNIFEGKRNFYCESGKDGCGFAVWKEDKYNGITVTSANMTTFLDGKPIYKQQKKLDGTTISTKYEMIDTGTYINIRKVKKE